MVGSRAGLGMVFVTLEFALQLEHGLHGSAPCTVTSLDHPSIQCEMLCKCQASMVKLPW